MVSKVLFIVSVNVFSFDQTSNFRVKVLEQQQKGDTKHVLLTYTLISKRGSKEKPSTMR